MMQRRSPLKRAMPLRKRRKEPRRSGRVKDREFMGWLHTIPCYVTVWLGERYSALISIPNREQRAAAFEEMVGRKRAWTCWGVITADHVGPRPLGRKSNDRQAIALCEYHHHCRQTYVGLWYGFDKVRMRAWADEATAWTQRLYAQHASPDRVLAVAMGEEE